MNITCWRWFIHPLCIYEILSCWMNIISLRRYTFWHSSIWVSCGCSCSCSAIAFHIEFYLWGSPLILSNVFKSFSNWLSVLNILCWLIEATKTTISIYTLVKYPCCNRHTIKILILKYKYGNNSSYCCQKKQNSEKIIRYFLAGQIKAAFISNHYIVFINNILAFFSYLLKLCYSIFFIKWPGSMNFISIISPHKPLTMFHIIYPLTFINRSIC